MSEPTRVVGTSVPRVDTVAKVTGGAVYGVDVRFAGDGLSIEVP